MTYIGRTVKVERLEGLQVYSVPDEIPDGEMVKVIGFDEGCFDVEYLGRKHAVPVECVDYFSFSPPIHRL